MDRVPVDRGFTLVEVMITTVILGTAMAVAIAALNTANVETTLGTANAVLQNDLDTFVEGLVTELRSATRSTISYETNGAPTTDYGNCMKFQVPVDQDQDGSVDVDANGNPIYGATLGMLHTAGSYIVYRFVANQGEGPGNPLDETVLGVDLNLDFDQTDVFTRGHFTRTAPDSVGSNVLRRMRGRWFLWGDGDADVIDDCGWDADNDGTYDPIFEEAADGTIRINILGVQMVGRNRVPARARVSTSVLPYNQ